MSKADQDPRYICPKNPNKYPHHSLKRLKCVYCGLKFKRRWVGHSSYCEYDRPDLDGSPAGILVPPKGTLKDRFNPTLEYHNTGDEPLRIMQVKINYGDPEIKHEGVK